LLANIII